MVLNLLFVLAISPNQIPQVDVVAINDAMIEFLEVHVSRHRDQVKKLNKLVQVVFSKNFMNLSYDNSRTKTAIETFETRSGNCLSFANMFMSMARYLGMEAYYQEVVNFPTWNKRGNVVMLNRHINVLVKIGTRNFVLDFNPYMNNREDAKSYVVSDERALAQYYNNLGAEFFQKGDHHNALDYFQFAIEISPELSFGWSNMGAAYSNIGRQEDAEAAYLKALELDRKEFTAMSNLARLYKKMGRLERANYYKKKVERFRKKNPYYHYSLGVSAFADQSYDDALKHFKNAVRRKPKDHDFHFELAKTYSQLGNPQKVELHLKKAREFARDIFQQNRYSQKLEMLTAQK